MKNISFVALLVPLVLWGCSMPTADNTAATGSTYDAGLIAELDKAVADDVYKLLNGIVVMKDGELLFERYYNDTKISSLHNPRSVGKTFASIVLGIALRDGHIESLDQTLADFYDLDKYKNPSPKKSAVTLRQLVTMSSGFNAFDFDPRSIGNEENMYPTDNWVDWALDLPMAGDRVPGDAWYYFTGGAVLLGDILDQSVPGGLEAYADRVLFKPMGIRKYQWEYTPQKVANTAGGLQMSARDFAKIGQLYANRGQWRGRQLVPADFVDMSFEAAFPDVGYGNGYGFFWWLKSYTVKGRDLPVAYASGNGGNKIFVFRDEPIVVAITASAYGQMYAHPQVDEIMERYILPAVL